MKWSTSPQSSQILRFSLLASLIGLVSCSDDAMSPRLEPAPEQRFSVTAAVSVSNLQVATGSIYKVVPNGHIIGARRYTDRLFALSIVPLEVLGLTYIQTANNDKSAFPGSTQFLKFTVDQPVTVYVAHHDAVPRPAWLRTNFTDTGLDVVNTTFSLTLFERFSVFKRDFPAGTITLGSNADVFTGYGHYTVMIKPTTAAPAPAPPPSPTGFDAVIRGIRPRGFSTGTYTLSQPGSGRKTYYVATTGNDVNPGTSSSPFRTINKAAQVAIAGDVVTIANGTYQESVMVRNSGTSTAPIVFQAQNRGGVVLSGGKYVFQPAGWFGGKPGTTGQFYVTIKGLIFRSYSNPYSTEHAAGSVRTFRGWRIEDCLFDRSGQNGVIVVDDDVTITKSTLQYHYTHALVAFGRGNGATSPTDTRFVGIKGLRLTDVVLRGNYTSPQSLDGRTSSSVAKIMGSVGTVVDNMESYQNNGPGLWLDADNSGYVVRNSYFHDNYSNPGISPGRGLHLELNWSSGLVENNVFANNAAEGLAVNQSQGIEVRYNLFVRNQECIRISDWTTRSGSVGQYSVKNVSIHHNQFKDWAQNACFNTYGDKSGSGGLNSSAALKTTNIVLNYNTYEPVRNRVLSGWWSDKGNLDTIEKIRAIGSELNGLIGAILSPI